MVNTQSFPFSDSIAITVIAGLLSLLPVVALLWVYYVREQRPTVSGRTVARFFLLGMLSVGGSVLLERGVYEFWKWISPDTASAFFADTLSLTDLPSLVAAALVAFGIIALAEEGVRYLLMRRAFQRPSDFDQLIDGVQYGFALGLGFAFVENTLYFLQLFRGLDFDTLAIVFFLRFLISTIGHLSFGGVMGYFLAMAAIHPGECRVFLRRAFWIPWIMHGFFDTLLSVQLSFYTVLLLSIPLIIFWQWFQDDRMFELHMLRGRRLRFPVASKQPALVSPRPYVVEAIPSMTLCPNCTAPVGDTDRQCRSCGLKLYRRGEKPLLPFLRKETS
jgi:RsiW-degrading membrane proteinase PrsW (M82 family)